jgi:hypothetical protein
LNPDVVQWGSLRELGPNNEVFSNADASLDRYIHGRRFDRALTLLVLLCWLV